MSSARFSTTIAGGDGKNVTGIVVPPEILASLGAGQRPRVRVSLNGYSYVSTVGKMGGDFMISLSAEHRKAAKLAAGDAVEVLLEVAAEPPMVVVPDDLRAALVAAGASDRFDAAAPSRRKEWVRGIDEAKSAETRARRVLKVVDELATKA